MRTLLLAVAIAAGLSCGKTYQELGTFACAQDHDCPDALTCILINGSGSCLQSLTCDPLATASCPGAADQESSRTRCTVMRTRTGLVESQCVHQYGKLPLNSGCQLLFAKNVGGGSSGGASDAFPLEDRSCANGTICHNLSMSGPTTSGSIASGFCRPFCKSDTDCAGGQRCLDAFDKRVTTATVEVSPRLGVCYPTCTILPASGSVSGCSVGEECALAANLAANTGLGVCQAPGFVTTNNSCDSQQTCMAGLACKPTGANFLCEKLCRVSQGSTPCKAGQTCVQSALALPDPDIGFCQ